MTIREALELSTAEQAAFYRHDPSQYKGFGDTGDLQGRKPANHTDDSQTYEHQVSLLTSVNMYEGLGWQRMVATNPVACLDMIFMAAFYAIHASERWRDGFENFLEKAYRITNGSLGNAAYSTL